MTRSWRLVSVQRKTKHNNDKHIASYIELIFSERDTYVHVRYMLSAVRLSSVTLVHPTQQVEIFRNFFRHTLAQRL